jgi:hypothetical protein
VIPLFAFFRKINYCEMSVSGFGTIFSQCPLTEGVPYLLYGDLR